MNPSARNSILCPNCRRLISVDEIRCPYCGVAKPGSRWKNNPLTSGWGSGEQIIKLIIYANVGLYILSLFIDQRGLNLGFNLLFALSPSIPSIEALGAVGVLLTGTTGRWWTLLSANYLHGSLLHILFNMMALYQLGTLITKLFGPYRFFVIYTISGVAGFYISVVAGVPRTVGASGAIFGLIGAALYYGKSRGGVFGQTLFRQIGGWALSFILIGFLLPIINNYAHIGGLVAGALTALLVGYHEKTRQNQWHRLLAAGCIVITVTVLLWAVWSGLRLWLRF